MRVTRREWNGLVVGGLVAGPLGRFGAQRPDSRIAGVRIGAQSYSFRGMSLDATISAMASIGLSYCELWQGQVETREALGLPPAPAGRRPPSLPREPLRAWRLNVPLDTFRRIREKYDAAGITLTAYNLSVTEDFTDAEITRAFEMCGALNVDVLTISSTVGIAPRIEPFAERHGVTVAFHNHAEEDQHFSSPAHFAAALAGRSSRIAINLDIGHFAAANHDAVAFLDQHHDRIVSLHIKDRRRDIGPHVPFGEGDAPIAAVLRRLRDRKWDIPAHIEYEYRGENATVEVAKCLAFCRSALTA